MSNPKGMRGFTLVEMMIIIVLLAIIATIAVPNYMQFIRNNQLLGKADEVTDFLQYARTQALAMRRSYTVTLADGQWSVGQTGQAAERTLTFNTAEASPSASVASFTFSPQGIASTAVRVILCRDGDFATGYLVEVRPSGLVRRHQRGRNADNTNLTSCTAAVDGGTP